ncbi:MAG: hypothetical protein ABSF51_14540, partial [Verrucomicrobiota bacterium]
MHLVELFTRYHGPKLKGRSRLKTTALVAEKERNRPLCNTSLLRAVTPGAKWLIVTCHAPQPQFQQGMKMLL